jgi:2-polyprenyl-6-methoxyphenol hydroxylase-like FAD-dependent oxidoreductase
MAEIPVLPVLIVGAGPVGLTLAIDLAWRGIAVTLIERRARGKLPPPKCNHTSARSMEIFRRLGVAQALRDAGLPADFPNDCAFRTTMTGIELARIPIPCRRDRYTATGGPDTWWPTPEPLHRINQIFLEPVLTDHAAALPLVTLLNRTALEEFSHDGMQVSATLRDLDTGETRTVSARRRGERALRPEARPVPPRPACRLARKRRTGRSAFADRPAQRRRGRVGPAARYALGLERAT